MSGSLRASSSNTVLLRAIEALAPDGIELALYNGLGGLPHFNPDLDSVLDDPKLPQPVRDLRKQVEMADGVLIACPEYAHGMPGAFKNALDWLVGGDEFIGKPVALLNASPGSTYAQASLREIITTMSGRIVREASVSVPLRGKKLDEASIVSDPELASILQAAIEAFMRALERFQAEIED